MNIDHYAKSVTSACLTGINTLRQAMEVANRQRAPRPTGVRLNRGVFSQTIASAKMGTVNRNRYITDYAKPKVNFAWSFALDGSASMTFSESEMEMGHAWGECVAILHVLHTVSQRLGGKSASALVHYEGSSEDAPIGASLNVTPIASVIKGESDFWKPDYPARLKRVKMGGGTSLVAYAETAIDLVKNIQADWKVAFFLTDGDCSDKKYLESLRLQALAEGIILIGIGIGVSGYGLPNGLNGENASQIAPVMLKHIADTIRSSH